MKKMIIKQKKHEINKKEKRKHEKCVKFEQRSKNCV